MILLPLASISLHITCALPGPYCGKAAFAVLIGIITEHAARLPHGSGEERAQGRKGCGFPVVATRENSQPSDAVGESLYQQLLSSQVTTEVSR